MKKYRIADFIVGLDYDESLIAPEFLKFTCDEDKNPDLVWKLTRESIRFDPALLEWKDMNNFKLAKQGDRVIVSYPNDCDIPYVVYENQYRLVTCYLASMYKASIPEEKMEAVKDCLFALHQEAFFLAMTYEGGFSIHSSTIIYQELGIVFSACSQTGKTTHTNLWKETVHTPVLDGDVTVCRIKDGIPVVYGLPWAGTSNQSMTACVTLGAIVFLEQGKENRVTTLTMAQSFQRLLSRTFSPLWYPELFTKVADNMKEVLTRMGQSYVLECLPEKEAVQCMKNRLDRDFVSK